MKIKVRKSSDLEAAINKYDQAVRDWGIAAYKVIHDIKRDRAVVSQLSADDEDLLWQMYKGDCLDKGLEATVEGFVAWKRIEYPELLKAREEAQKMWQEGF